MSGYKLTKALHFVPRIMYVKLVRVSPNIKYLRGIGFHTYKLLGKIKHFIKTKKDGYEQHYRDLGQEVNWKKAIKRSLSIIFGVVARVFSYLFNIIATILLVCLITGIVSGTVFIFYLKKPLYVSF